MLSARFLFRYTALVAGAAATISLAAPAQPASATELTRLDVTYSDGSIVDGPLSFGLSELPDTVDTRFILEGIGTTPGAISTFGMDSLVSFDFAFGDARLTEADLESFTLELIPDTNGDPLVNDLIWQTVASPDCESGTALCGVVANFPLTITGTDLSSGGDFEYEYAQSSESLTEIPAPATLALFAFGLAVLGGALGTWRRTGPPHGAGRLRE